MSSVNRRSFFQTAAKTAAGLAAVTAPARLLAQQDDESTTTNAPGRRSPAVPSPPRIQLGATGIEMTRLGQGTGVHGGNRQSDQTRMGFERLVGLFRHAYDRGVRFFDLADLYGTHVYFREALRTIPRDEVTILTKVWWRYDGSEEETAASHRRGMCEATLDRFRHELNTDTIDIVLLHCMTDPAWPEKMRPYMDTLSQEKEKGRIRAVGVSCHALPALKAAVGTPWVDVILARINPKGVLMDGSTEEVVSVLRQAKTAGKAIIGMKIFGEGQLAAEREQCMQFAQRQEFLDAMTIGFDSPHQIDDVLRLMARFPAVRV